MINCDFIFSNKRFLPNQYTVMGGILSKKKEVVVDPRILPVLPVFAGWPAEDYGGEEGNLVHEFDLNGAQPAHITVAEYQKLVAESDEVKHKRTLGLDVSGDDEDRHLYYRRARVVEYVDGAPRSAFEAYFLVSPAYQTVVTEYINRKKARDAYYAAEAAAKQARAEDEARSAAKRAEYGAMIGDAASAAKPYAVPLLNATSAVVARRNLEDAARLRSKAAYASTAAERESLHAQAEKLELSGRNLSDVRSIVSSVNRDMQGYTGAAEYYGGQSSAVFYGGNELDLAVIKHYGETLNSFTKQALVKDLVGALKDLGFTPAGETIDEQVKSLVDILPNSRNKKTFKDDVAVHEKVCRRLSEHINKHVGAEVISPSLGPEATCQAVSELIASLTSGMHVEFLAVQGNVRTAIGNLHILREQLNKVFDPLLKVASAADSKLQVKSAKLKGIYNLIVAEIDRQLAMLVNLLDVTLSPTEAHLVEMIKDDPELSGIVESYAARSGDKQFSSVIAKVIANVGLTAEYALVVDAALKRVGMTVAEYAASPSLRTLANKVGEALVEREYDDKSLYDFLQSAELLYKNYYRAKDIRELLHKVGAGMDSDNEEHDVYGLGTAHGGVDATELEYEQSSVDKRVRMKGEVRKIIFDTFSRALDEHMKVILAALVAVGNKMNVGLEDSDEIRGFADALDRLRPLLSRKNSYLALVGYYADAQSKERRDTFVGQLSLIASYADAIVAMPLYSAIADQMRDLSAAIRSMKTAIDQYSGKIAQKYGGDDDEQALVDPTSYDGGAEDLPCADDDGLPGQRAAGCMGLDVEGGASFLATTKALSTPTWALPDQGIERRVPRDLAEAITRFTYFHKTAQIRRQMNKAAGELDHYAAKYETIRAEAIAKKIDKINRDAAGLLKVLGAGSYSSEKVPDGLTPDEQLCWSYVVASPADRKDATKTAEVKAKDKLRAATIRVVEQQTRARADFWRTIEAVDEYMRLFTTELAKSKGSLSDIKSMLDDTEVIVDWYDDETGTLIHRAFDTLQPTWNASAGARPPVYENSKVAAAWSTAQSHYYEALNVAALRGRLRAQPELRPAAPQTATLPDDETNGFSGFEAMKKVMRKLALLKNILSVFVHIGRKYSDTKKLFMTPTQIYKNLLSWIEICSFGLGGGDVPAIGGAPAGEKAFADKFGMYFRSIGQTWKDEDDMFACVVKSMCAKVLVVVGMYDMFERPEEKVVYSALRYIIGGGEATVDEKCLELYVRLPLLAEFYRDLFDFDPLAGDNAADFIANNEIVSRAEKISMLPEMEGPFGGLVRLVFQRARGVTLVDYSDIELRELIAEVNLIYSRMAAAGGENPTTFIIDEFIREVNMRYGVISKRDRDTYLSEFGERQKYADQSEDRALDIPILPGEEEMDFEKGVIAPSRRFEEAGSALTGIDVKKSPNFIQDQHVQLVNRFRCMLDSYFRQPSDTTDVERAIIANYNTGRPSKVYKAEESMSKVSLRPAIKTARMKLAVEQSAEARFRIIAQMIRGSGLLSQADHLKHVMFHETVIAGLNTLSAVYTLLRKFRDNALATDLKTIMKLAGAAPGKLAADIEIALRDLYIGGDNAMTEANPFAGALTKFVRTAANPIVNTLTSIQTQIKTGAVAEALVNSIWSIGSDSQGLVIVRVDDNHINVNFSPLKEKCLAMLAALRRFVEVMRPHIDPTILERYVAKQRVGSIYWFQEQLVEKLFDGRSAALAAQSGKVEYVTVDASVRVINNTLNILRSNIAGTPDVKTAANNVLCWGQTLAKLTFYDSQEAQSGIAEMPAGSHGEYVGSAAIPASRASCGIDFTHPLNKLLLLNQGAKQIVYPDMSNRFHQLYSWDPKAYVPNSSLVLSFNQLLAKYLSVCYDSSAEKIYINTVAGLVNSAVGGSVADLSKTFPDCVAGGTRIEVQSAKAGPIDPSALTALTFIRDDATAVDAAALVQAAKNNHGAIHPGRDLPAFLVDLSNNTAARFASVAALKATAQAVYDQYHKNSSSYYVGRESATAGEVPVPVQVNNAASHNTTKEFGHRTDPSPDAILFTSLALILRNIMNSKNSANQTPIYALDNIAEVTAFKKEALRAHLPAFKALFVSLAGRAEYLKKIIGMAGVTGHRVQDRSVAAWVPADITSGLSGFGQRAVDGAGLHEDQLVHFASIATAVTTACMAVVGCIDHVNRELADSPKYLELHAGSISEHKSAYGKAPLMPLSSALWVLRNDAGVLPTSVLGTPEFKFAYGVRGLFSADRVVSGDSVPGFSGLIDLYNLVVPAREQIQGVDGAALFDTLVPLLRFAHESRNVKSRLVAPQHDYLSTAATLVSGNRSSLGMASSALAVNETAVGTTHNNAPVYALSPNVDLRMVLDITLNADQDRKLETIARHVAAEQKHSGKLTVANILDLNVMPINVHALMRDIPLMNLYNYSYTFDRLLIDLYYGVHEDFADTLMWRLCAGTDRNIGSSAGDLQSGMFRSSASSFIKSSKDQFVAMMLQPYGVADAQQYKWFGEICRGDSNLPLGRPKLLGDQLLNKALFGDLYPTGSDYYNRRGPVNHDANRTTLTYQRSRSDRMDAPEAVPIGVDITSVVADPSDLTIVRDIGRKRFDTVFLRNLVLLTNTYRTMLLRLRSDLSRSTSIVASSAAAIREENTELSGDAVHGPSRQMQLSGRRHNPAEYANL